MQLTEFKETHEKQQDYWWSAYQFKRWAEIAFMGRYWLRPGMGAGCNGVKGWCRVIVEVMVKSKVRLLWSLGPHLIFVHNKY